MNGHGLTTLYWQWGGKKKCDWKHIEGQCEKMSVTLKDVFCFFFCWQNISNNFSTPKKEQKIASELLFPTHWKCPGNGYIQKLACSVNLWPGGGDDFWKGGKKCSEHFTIRFL